MVLGGHADPAVAAGVEIRLANLDDDFALLAVGRLPSRRLARQWVRRGRCGADAGGQSDPARVEFSRERVRHGLR
jgi:hypothetical protein